MILVLLIVFFFMLVILMIPVAAIKMYRAKPIVCPQCEMEFKIISNRGKCPNCKGKLFKHVSGEYRLRA